MMETGAPSLDGKFALLLHSESDVGRAVARWLTARGARVVCLDRREWNAVDGEEMPLALPFIPVEIRDSEDVRRAVDTAQAMTGGFDLLVTLGRRRFDGPVESADFDDMIDVMNLSVRGRIAAMQAAIPYLRARGGGTILHLTAGFEDGCWRNFGYWNCDQNPEPLPCNEANHLLVATSRTAREEVRHDNIQILLLHAGPLGRMPITSEEREKPDPRWEINPWKFLDLCLESAFEHQDESSLPYPGDWQTLSGTSLFEEIDRIADPDLRRSLSALSREELAYALKGAPPAVVDKVKGLMSDRAARKLEDDIEFVRDSSEREIFKARQKIGMHLYIYLRHGNYRIRGKG